MVGKAAISGNLSHRGPAEARGRRESDKESGGLLHAPGSPDLLPSPPLAEPSQKAEGAGGSAPRTAQSGAFCMAWVDNDQHGDVCTDSEKGEDNVGQHITCGKSEHLRTPEEGSWGPSCGHRCCRLPGKGDREEERKWHRGRQGGRGREEDSSAWRREQKTTSQALTRASWSPEACRGRSPPQGQLRHPSQDLRALHKELISSTIK